jgi:putative restriction endonuclease
MKGIHRAHAQRGPAALSINTSVRSPYDDVETPDGFLYAYRAGSIDQPDNRALRAAFTLAVPIVYFVGTRPGWYRPLYPCYILEDDRVARRVLVSVGAMTGPVDEPHPAPLDDPLERRYAVRQTRARLHQARFRGRVLPAYNDRCSICRLREQRLLDAAHIVGDADQAGVASISNGLSMCSIHHRAFDQDLIGISPDYEVRVSERLLQDEDGPMLDLLKASHQATIDLPSRKTWRPDRDLLAVRFARFAAATEI